VPCRCRRYCLLEAVCARDKEEVVLSGVFIEANCTAPIFTPNLSFCVVHGMDVLRVEIQQPARWATEKSGSHTMEHTRQHPPCIPSPHNRYNHSVERNWGFVEVYTRTCYPMLLAAASDGLLESYCEGCVVHDTLGPLLIEDDVTHVIPQAMAGPSRDDAVVVVNTLRVQCPGRHRCIFVRCHRDRVGVIVVGGGQQTASARVGACV
jgi:hypothetical protein